MGMMPGEHERRRRCAPEDLRRVLLVELLADDPFDQHRTEFYPFLQGHVRSQGGACDWVALAAGADTRPDHPYEVDLPGPRLERLCEAARTLRPSLVLLNERLSERSLVALRQAAGTARLFNPPDTPGELLHMHPDPPDYQCRRLDPDNPTGDHFQQIMVLPRCTYRRTVRNNPHYAGVDVDTLPHQVGCSFCPQGGESQPIPSPDEALELTLNQLVRYHETVPGELRRRRFLMFTVPMLSRIDELAHGLVAAGLPPSELYVTCRVDAFLNMADAARRALPKMQEHGHQLHLWQVGLENYSERENRRMNKGISPAQIDRFVQTVDELEAAWPESFFFRRHGGFAMIMFTPWTRPEDLRLNIAGVRRHRMDAGAFLLSSRLMLRDGTPITALADGDGLSLRSGEGTSRTFGSYCITHWGEDEVPWRFRDPGVDRTYRLMALLSHRDDPAFPIQNAEEVRQAAGLHRRRLPKAADMLEQIINTLDEDPGASDLQVVRRLFDPGL